MASEDVIELDSTDDEAEPVPKKKKPTPNIMVRIPSKLPDITIKPAKTGPSSHKVQMSKQVVIKKADMKSNPNISKEKHKSGPIRISKFSGMKVKNCLPIQNKVSINPLSVTNTFSKTHLVVKKLPSNKRLRNPVAAQGPKLLNNLPPGITIKPVQNTEVTIKPVQQAGISVVSKKGRLVSSKKGSQELLTVELDDEDITEAATARPQWYLRPEQQTKPMVEDVCKTNMQNGDIEMSMEVKNNKEPEKTLVEITIDDSPIKHIHTKHPDIGKELSITIEDSPVKTFEKVSKEVESDDEISETTKIKHPRSKKKLNYPKENKNVKDKQIIEIEIDLQDCQSVKVDESKCEEQSPSCSNGENEKLLPKVVVQEEKISNKEAIVETETKEISSDANEFHPIYQKFIDVCFQLENTEDMKKIVEKKIKAYYRQSPKGYVESDEFIDMVSSKIISMKAAPEKMYLYIKDIVDELNLQRKRPKEIISSVQNENVLAPSNIKCEGQPFDSKKQRQIRKLEKTIKKLHRAIQKLEEQEVDFDDDDDSVYLLTERYKERMVRVHAKFCQLTNTKMPSEPRIHIEARPGQPTGPAKKLEKWINRKVPIGTPLPFPDFHDVLRCVRDANDECKLGWNDVDIMEEARDLFTRCGKKLQRRRQENEWRIAASRICVEIDPAENSSELKKKLDENKTVAAKRESELLNKYADRQNVLQLEAVEIGDKEADESPVESEEEDIIENDNSLEDKQKRKDRLKRLLKEKSRKDDDKENSVKVRRVSEEKDLQNEGKGENALEKHFDADKLDSVQELAESKTDESKMTSAKEDLDNENDDSDSDINKVESDIDELHLLQKLHSENEANETSTHESSDYDTPIAMSDTLESDSEIDGVKSCDVISIENSSYSESEAVVESSNDNDTKSIKMQNVEQLVKDNFEIEYSSNGIKECSKETEKVGVTGEIEENILLASSDDDDNINKPGEVEDTCINLRDDNISISETVVNGGTIEDENGSNDALSLPENNNAIEVEDESHKIEESIVPMETSTSSS